MSCGVSFRQGSDPVLLWLWCRPATTALIRPLAWEPPYAAGAALKRKKKKFLHNRIQQSHGVLRFFLCFLPFILKYGGAAFPRGHKMVATLPSITSPLPNPFSKHERRSDGKIKNFLVIGSLLSQRGKSFPDIQGDMPLHLNEENRVTHPL